MYLLMIAIAPMVLLTLSKLVFWMRLTELKLPVKELMFKSPNLIGDLRMVFMLSVSNVLRIVTLPTTDMLRF